ncbi:MAG: DNA mismatch repair endonuclease MutH [Gammaproteobacteria bacterium]|nr:DNA mismatch repair endonuclease MutH [Gammaproteobacteria bacterium]
MIAPPASEVELLTRAHALAGLTLDALAGQLEEILPTAGLHAKGWIGTLLENALGADAGARPMPDFTQLGVELKSIPVGADGQPRESTFVCTAPVIVPPAMQWENSTVHDKLRRVLWIPIESGAQKFGARRIGWGFLWSPTPEQDTVLRYDWQELIDLIALGQWTQITARLGRYLQLRPKAAHGRTLRAAVDDSGTPNQTLPRGFYLRATFTHEILAAHLRAAHRQ